MWARGFIVIVALVECFSYTAAEDVQSLIQRESLFEIVIDQVRKYPDVVREQLTKLTTEDNRRDLDKFLSAIDDEEPQPPLDELICPICKAAIGLLREIAENKTWDDIRDEVIGMCIYIFVETGGDPEASEVMCVGVMDLQGLHLMLVIQALPEDPPPIPPGPPGGSELLCEHLNACIAPEGGGPGGPGNKMRKETKRSGSARRSRHKRSVSDGGIDRSSHYAKGNTKTSNQTDQLTIVQLTDIHIDPHYAEGSASDCGYFVCCRDEYPGDGKARPYGEYTCNTPQKTMNLFLDEVAKMKPDFIIYAGDTPPHSMWEETYHSQLNCTAILIESLTKTMPGYTVYPNIGNHEMFPTNIFSLDLNETKSMSMEFAEMWKPLANFSQDQIDTMHEGGYYTMLVKPKLRILSFNTNYWYTFNWYNCLNSLHDDFHAMFTFMEETLAAARDDGEKVIIIGHHPPGGSDMIVTYTRLYTDMAVEYSDVIVLHVAGHTHKDEFRVATNDDGEAETVVLAAPSMTSLGTMNPSMRVFHMDATTFEVQDYDQYYFDLESAMKTNNTPAIVRSYSAKEEYGLTDLSAREWLDLVKRMSQDFDLFQKYYYNYYGRTENSDACGDSCYVSHLCSLSNTNFDENRQCVSAHDLTVPPPTAGNDTTSTRGSTSPIGSTTPVPTTSPDVGDARMLTPCLLLMTLAMLALLDMM